MYLSAGLKVGNDIYLTESFSRCLISIHIPSGESRVEAYLPWEYKEGNIGMLLFNQKILIYSPAINHFLIYDCLKKQISTVELQGIEADQAGFFYSNVLVDQENFIVLPFKGKEIKRYGMNGKLKFTDNQWCFAVSRECGYDEKLFVNIRMNSACIAGNQLFFSLIYGNRNYLCKYELDQDKHLCNIIYHSDEIAIRGVYAYSNMILFRRLFLDKTEIVQITLSSNEQKVNTIDYPFMFEGDIYGDGHKLMLSSKNEILSIERNNLNVCQKVYDFETADAYIANGILFNVMKNEIFIPDVDCIRKYSIEKTIREIKNSDSYQEGRRKLINGKCILEEKFKLHHLLYYFTEKVNLMVEKKCSVENMAIGELIWRTI